jgi:hypothetical protein
MVSDSCIRKIAIALKSDQMIDTCRNNRIAALILDDLYTVDELANMSLSGRKCPGQDRVAKSKLPPDIVTAIHSRPIACNLNSISYLISLFVFFQTTCKKFGTMLLLPGMKKTT